jgi:hypothetical protein
MENRSSAFAAFFYAIVMKRWRQDAGAPLLVIFQQSVGRLRWRIKRTAGFNMYLTHCVFS